MHGQFHIIVAFGTIICSPWLVSCEKQAQSNDEPVITSEPKIRTKLDRKVREKFDVYDIASRIKRMTASEVKENYTEIHEFIVGASIAEINQFLSSLDLKSNSNQIVIINTMMELSKKDVKSYIHFAFQMDEKSNLLIAEDLLENLIKADKAEIISFIESGDHNTEVSAKFSASLLESLLAVDPSSGVALLSRVETENRDTLIAKGFRSWGKENASAALAGARAFGNETSMPGIVSAILEGAATDNPAEAFKLALAEGVDFSDKAYKVVFFEWLAKEPLVADVEILKLPTDAFLGVFGSRPDLVADLSRRNSEAVAGILSKVELNSTSREVFESASRVMTAENPESSLIWLKNLSESTIKNDLVVSAYRDWAVEDQNAAIKKVLELKGVEKDVALDGLTLAVAKRDPLAALNIATLLPTSLQSSYLSRVLEIASANGSKETISLLGNPIFTSSVLAQPEIQGQIERITAAYAEKSLDSCKTWVESLTDGQRAAAVGGLVASWMKVDPLAAAGWLGELEPSSAKDAGIRSLVTEIKETDPATAAQWELLLGE